MDTSIVTPNTADSNKKPTWDRVIKCRVCQNDFERKHWNQFICSDTCKTEAQRQAKIAYKKTEKGRESNKRWTTSVRFKSNEKKYRQTERGRKLASEIQKRYIAAHPEAKIRKRKADKKYSNTEQGQLVRRSAAKKYRQTDKYKFVMRLNKAARRGAPGSYTREQWESLLARYNGGCAYCGSTRKMHADHIVPVSKGGSNCIENIQPLCVHCNTSKRDKVYIPLVPLIENNYVLVG